MAEVRLLPLEETLSANELAELTKQLRELGVETLPEGDDVADFSDAMSEDQLTDFMDKLEAHEIACDVYLPVEFEGRVVVGDYSVGSAFTLADALDELREELNIEGEADEDSEIAVVDDEDDRLELVEEQLTHAWQVFSRAAGAAATRQIPLHVIS